MERDNTNIDVTNNIIRYKKIKKVLTKYGLFTYAFNSHQSIFI